MPLYDGVALGLQGHSNSQKDYDFRIVDKAAQVEVRMQGDQHLINASAWFGQCLQYNPSSRSPQKPGQEASSTYTYTSPILPSTNSASGEGPSAPYLYSAECLTSPTA
jgi:hypothetical protein